MRAEPTITGTKRIAVALATALLLAGCGATEMFDSNDEEPLVGERISVLEHGQGFNPDPEVAALQVVLPGALTNDAWPQAGGDPNHSMQHLALVGTLNQVWRVSVGSGGDSYRPLVSEPVSAGGRIYAMDSATNVGAFDVSTGDLVWRRDLTPESEDELFGGGLATDGARVYATTDYGYVYAVDASNGEIIWTTRIDSPVRAPPGFADGRLIVVTLDNRTLAMSMETGEIQWTHTGPVGQASLLGATSPAIEGDTVVVAYTSGDVFALDATTGEARWSDALTSRLMRESATRVGGVTGRIVIDQGVVYVSGNAGTTVAVDQATGLRVWERAASSSKGPWVAGDFIFMVTSDQVLICLTRGGGQIKWYQALPRFLDPEDNSGPISWSGPVLAGDRLIVVSSEGAGMTISPYTGEVVGQFELAAGTRISPIVVNGGLYLLLGDASLVALR
ncbi:MAG: PQQ-binding-like beta-propeller repeat protein [Rhodospirillaceae bacterium]|nr:PQQ-binding-like beta-propeller repeat protein [Rhodospirillaceae bacterium]